MRLLKLSLACSLDQYIAGPKGEIDWIRMDADYGLAQFIGSVDVTLIGRKTYDFAVAYQGSFKPMMRTSVFTSKPPADKATGLHFVTDDAVQFTRDLKKKHKGKDLWLIGGHALAESLLAADLVDEIRLAVHPMLLGGGVPLFGALKKRQQWHLEGAKAHDNGVVVMSYSRA